MKLKMYQSRALNELSSYLETIQRYPHENSASIAFVSKTNSPYKPAPGIENTPFVCVKIPTGGGKTLVATHAIGSLFDAYIPERNDKGLVLWFVPSDPIKLQTLRNLKNRKHDFRKALDERFGNHVLVIDLEEAKKIKPENIRDNACVVVTTLASFRREDTAWLKAYQDNGYLLDHFEGLKVEDFDFLQKDKNGEIIFSLVNVIRLNNPLVIVDEGHNSQTELSFAMLEDLNPSFVLEFTATPRTQSNVLVQVSAQELKAESMIKMPLYLANKVPWQDTIRAGIEKRDELWEIARKNKEYIRPIMLIQAEQEIENDKKVYVTKIRDFLVNEAGIDKEQIAIRTGNINELPDQDILLSKECPISYIITVNALREGWDCPFAYILVSVSNLGAQLPIEQTIGRIMRLPYVKEHTNPALNAAYIFASTANFTETSNAIISGLEKNGYTDVIAQGGEVGLVDTVVKQVIEDENVLLPFITVNAGSNPHTLDYLSDLVSPSETLKEIETTIQLADSNADFVEKIDLVAGELIRGTTGKLGLLYKHQDITKESLLLWFGQKVQRIFIAHSDMSTFLLQVIDNLLEVQSVETISARRYEVLAKIQTNIDEKILELASKEFDQLEAKKVLNGSLMYDLPKELALSQVAKTSYSKHLFDKAGGMNNEEIVLADQLDKLDNIVWWWRNPEFTGFFLQGWKSQRFFPDFIVKTLSGEYFVIEYKGEHLLGSDDSVYKESLGKRWEKVVGSNYNFLFCTSKNLAEVVTLVSGK